MRRCQAISAEVASQVRLAALGRQTASGRRPQQNCRIRRRSVSRQAATVGARVQRTATASRAHEWKSHFTATAAEMHASKWGWGSEATKREMQAPASGCLGNRPDAAIAQVAAIYIIADLDILSAGVHAVSMRILRCSFCCLLSSANVESERTKATAKKEFFNNFIKKKKYIQPDAKCKQTCKL